MGNVLLKDKNISVHIYFVSNIRYNIYGNGFHSFAEQTANKKMEVFAMSKNGKKISALRTEQKL